MTELRALIEELRAKRIKVKDQDHNGFWFDAYESDPLSVKAADAIAKLLAAAEQALSAPPQTDDWTVDDSETAREILNYLGLGSNASLEPGDRRRDKISKMIRARIDAAPAAVPAWQVKPLEWRTFCSNSGNCEAKTSWGEYIIQIETDGWVLFLPNEQDDGTAHSTLEYAQAAAQADYEQRIRSALLPSAGPAWQTMDSAPKDGTLVLLCFDHHPVTIGRFEYGTWVYAFCLTEGGDSPTGWQPLPAAPLPNRRRRS